MYNIHNRALIDWNYQTILFLNQFCALQSNDNVSIQYNTILYDSFDPKKRDLKLKLNVRFCLVQGKLRKLKHLKRVKN